MRGVNKPLALLKKDVGDVVPDSAPGDAINDYRWLTPGSAAGHRELNGAGNSPLSERPLGALIYRVAPLSVWLIHRTWTIVSADTIEVAGEGAEMINEHIDHTPRWRRAPYLGTLHRPVRSSRRSDAEGATQHYYAVVEPAGTGGFRIRFPDRPSITSAAMTVQDIVAQAQDVLALMLRHPAADLPRSIEEGAEPPTNLNGYVDPLVVVIPFERVPAAKVA